MEEHNTERWKSHQRDKLLRQEPVLQIFKRIRAARWLTTLLKSMGVHYRDLPLGTYRVITTNVRTCPCCGQNYLTKERV